MTQSRPTLTVIGGPHDGTTLLLESTGERLLGSGPSAHLKLDLSNVAAVHARLKWDGRRLSLSDAGSETGTYVNGERLSAERVLGDGDRIFLGPPGSKNTAKLLATGVPAPASGDAVVLNLESEPIILHDADPARAAKPTPAAPAKPATAPSGAPAATPEPGSRPPSTRPAPGASPKPDYATDPPSIAPADRVREELTLPPEPGRAKKPAAPRMPAFDLSAVPRGALIAAAAAVLAGGGVWLFVSLRQPAPVLNSVTPPRIEPGQTLTLTGAGFASTPDANAVRIGSETGKITSASETQIAVSIPAAVAGGEVQVRVERQGRASNALFVKVFRAPRIDKLEPDVVLPGAEVVARGQNLGESAVVVVGGVTAQILEAKVDAVRFRVPADPSFTLGRGVAVHVGVGNDTTKPATLFLGQLPYVFEVVPPRGQAGDRLTIKGRGFDSNPRGNLVTLGSRPALVLHASETELGVAAPGSSGQAQADLTVVVRARGGTSSGSAAFTLMRPSLGSYTPRYSPEPAVEHPGHDHALVACELGPVLLLTGKADAASTAERAAKLAAALNSLSDAAAAVTFEVRERPLLGVAVAGRPELLVAVTAEDAAGYGEAWSQSGGARTPAPERMAAYWVALLQDHRLLFFEKDRPINVLALSPRGKALTDLYAEAARRSGPGQGVPSSVVGTLTPQMLRELRDLALLLPSGDAAQGAASARAVEGLWQGTLEEAGTPVKPVSVRLRMEGARLGGTLTTRIGKVGMDVPLRDVSYDKGQLRFTLVSGGTSRVFSGALRGDTLSGTIETPGAKEPAGRFSLKYQQ